MIRINLLPPEERQSRVSLKRIFVGISMVVALVIITTYSYTVFTLWNIEQQIHETHNQYQLLRPTQEVMVATNAKQQIMNTKNNILIGLTKERKSWYSLITHLSSVTIPQVWLSEVGVAENNMLRIKGMAYTYPDVAAFLQKIDQDDIFAEPALVNAERDTATAATKFEIMVKLKGR